MSKKAKFFASLSGIGLIVLACYLSAMGQSIIISGHEFEAELVSSDKEKKVGLGGRDSLCSNCAMVFIFSKEGIYPFWMKDVRFDLDIIWVANDKIVHIARDVSYGSLEIIDPGVSADRVVEINSGLVDAFGMKVGDAVRMK